LHEVPIGRGFHWEHKETLEYRGTLRVWQGQGRALTAANSLDLEAYLESTVGSEMRSDLPPAFSQAQAIAARSTVLATANRHHYSDGFDLCNDDHCQCYQGTTREANAVVEPVKLTAGRVLIFRERQGRASTESTRCVDARYAKACGGISERYEACWGEDGPDYFAIRACGDFEVPDLTIEKEAADFIKLPPRAWCNEKIHPYPDPWDKDPLFRWKFVHTRIQLGDLIHEKTGTPTGPIQALHVIRRGKSGRILILDIVGAVGTIRLFGELNIRRALSKSHLPSSYFIIEQDRDHITLIGAGWGHGVGLCQLGASAMAKAGMSVEKILEHYYPGSEVDLTQSPRQ
jgi:peptidoglycan hydrolase-like amidase